MKPDYKEKWVKALRSGDYLQTQLQLKGVESFCCLGVLCDVSGATWKEHILYDDMYPTINDIVLGIQGSLTYEGLAVFGLTNFQSTQLVKMNDEEGKNFSQIADYIEATL